MKNILAKLFLISFFSLFVSILLSAKAFASQYNSRPIEKVAVFPIHNAPAATSDEAWWQTRDALTKNKFFLVASRRLMVNRGVFVGKSELSASDTIILGKILESDAVWISSVEDRKLFVKVYECETGGLIWEKAFDFHSTIPIKDQLVKVSTDAVATFNLEIPYHGVQIPFSEDRVIEEKSGKFFAKVKPFANVQVGVGDNVQWIRLDDDRKTALFSESTQIAVLARGTIISKGEKFLEVEISDSESLQTLKEDALIRFPLETKRSREKLESENRVAELSHEYLSAELKKTSDIKKENSSTTTTLAILVNLATFILLGF